MEQKEIIAKLNDDFRRSYIGGRVFYTNGVHFLSNAILAEVDRLVKEFSDFTADNDPYGEHDFGSFTIEGRKIFWKIDYYDKEMKYGSEDPSDPKQTTRVLTVMLAEEY